MSNLNKYFLPYQLKWLSDKSKIKIWEKSRRIGATYVQSYEDVRDCVSGKVPAVWFSSADESAAKGYINYCEKWAKLFDKAAKSLGSVVIDKESDIKALVIEFSNGSKICALSSNPKGFRSKGGKVVLDEFAHHDNQESLWQAARPCITWGYPLRILSTHNGQNSKFFKFIEDVKAAKLKWALHTVDIHQAVDEGLVDKILRHKATEEECLAWLEEQRADCGDEFTWLQEYCCIAIDESCSFLPYELLYPCEVDNILKPLEDIKNDLYVGVDIGRHKDLTVIWLLEVFENYKYTRMVKILEKTPFHIQWEVLSKILQHKMLRRCCIDATGLGMQLAETAQLKYGQYRVEPVTFTNRIKEDLAYNLRSNIEGRHVVIPVDTDIREDLHAIRKFVTKAGNIRFDADSSEIKGHADRFWALALALHACSTNKGEINVASRKPREMVDVLKNY